MAAAEVVPSGRLGKVLVFLLLELIAFYQHNSLAILSSLSFYVWLSILRLLFFLCTPVHSDPSFDQRWEERLNVGG